MVEGIYSELELKSKDDEVKSKIVVKGASLITRFLLVNTLVRINWFKRRAFKVGP